MTNPGSQAELVRRSLKRRYRKERRFRFYGIAAISIALFSLVILFTGALDNMVRMPLERIFMATRRRNG